MNFIRFLLLTAIGSAVWNTTLICIGAGLGAAWEKAMPYLDKYTHIAVAILCIVFLAFVIFYFYRRNKNITKNNKQNEEDK